MTTYNIYSIPYEIDNPPYLELLFKHTEGIVPDESAFYFHRFSWKHLFFSPYLKGERRIVHIHWPTNVYGSAYILVSLFRMAVRFPAFWLLKLRRVKIIWTMHNMRAHDYPHPMIDDFGMFLMWKLADTVIIQERVFAKSESARRKSSRIVCIPPGNYIGVYGSLWQGDKDKLRKKFGMKQGEIVLLSQGSIRPYKMLSPLIRAVIEANKEGAPIHLLIAGKAIPEYAETLKEQAGNSNAVIFRFGFIKDSEMPELFALADYSVFYYGASALGSAAIPLSLSYGVPVITRDFPASELVVEGKGGFVFHDENDLKKILLTLASVPAFDRDAVIGTIAKQDWKSTGLKLREAYVGLWYNDKK